MPTVGHGPSRPAVGLGPISKISTAGQVMTFTGKFVFNLYIVFDFARTIIALLYSRVCDRVAASKILPDDVTESLVV